MGLAVVAPLLQPLAVDPTLFRGNGFQSVVAESDLMSVPGAEHDGAVTG